MPKVYRCIPLFVVMSVMPITATAQEVTKDDSARGWKKSAIVGLSVTQAAYSNWKAGGDGSFAGKGGFDVLLEHDSEALHTANLLQVAYGRSWSDELGWRKIDDLIRYNLASAYKTSSTVKPSLSVDFRTQITDGFDYDLADDRVRISAFMSPGYLIETAGITVDPAEELTALLGIAAKQTFVLEESLRNPENLSFPETNGYGNAPDESVRNEVGLNLNAVASGPIAMNVLGRSELSVFAAFDQLDEPDVRWNTLLQLKINDWLNTTVEAEVFYDRDQSTDVQWRQLLSVGVAFNLI